MTKLFLWGEAGLVIGRPIDDWLASKP